MSALDALSQHLSPPTAQNASKNVASDDSDGDTASQLSISLDSVPPSPLDPVSLLQASPRSPSFPSALSDKSGGFPSTFRNLLSATQPFFDDAVKSKDNAVLSPTTPLSHFQTPTAPTHKPLIQHETHDGEPVSQRTVPLAESASPESESIRSFHPSTDISSDADDLSLYKTRVSSITSATPSSYAYEGDDVVSLNGTSSRKVRPESLLVQPNKGSLVLGIALVDFNHLVGPRIEYCKGSIFDDDELSKFLPFLALPDGAHMSAEDYSYFHLVPSRPAPSTIFGISCNMQIATSKLLAKEADVTRSTVQKAVVILATKPAFGPIRDKLGVVTRALFNQLDFREMDLLSDFYASLESSLKTQMTESGLYMGTSLRQLLHTFRHRALLLLKALMLQKRIMFYGHPVERLCTYQYSLISLIPDLLHTLEDCGSPPLAARAPTLSRPTELRTSDRKSMMRYLGMPLDIFGKDAFFQPYLPLQQLDMIKDTRSWLCGTTNTIVTQQKEIDLLVNIETGVFEFRDPKLERVIGLTPADRKWIDDLVRDVNEGWDDQDPTRVLGMQFKGSDDYLRTKFEEYISAALASVRYRDFVAKGEGNGVVIASGAGGDAASAEDFSLLWIAELKRTNAYDVWDRTTDPMLFDIVEPRHPCIDKPSVVADIGLRLAEGIQELKLDQQLAPTKEAISRTISAGSTGFLKAMEGVRGRWAGQKTGSASSSEVSLHEGKTASEGAGSNAGTPTRGSVPMEIFNASRPTSVASTTSSTSATGNVSATTTPIEPRPMLGSWSGSFGSFFASRKMPRSSLPLSGGSPKPMPPMPVEHEETRIHSLDRELPRPPADGASVQGDESSTTSPGSESWVGIGKGGQEDADGEKVEEQVIATAL